MRRYRNTFTRGTKYKDAETNKELTFRVEIYQTASGLYSVAYWYTTKDFRGEFWTNRSHFKSINGLVRDFDCHARRINLPTEVALQFSNEIRAHYELAREKES